MEINSTYRSMALLMSNGHCSYIHTFATIPATGSKAEYAAVNRTRRDGGQAAMMTHYAWLSGGSTSLSNSLYVRTTNYWRRK